MYPTNQNCMIPYNEPPANYNNFEGFPQYFPEYSNVPFGVYGQPQPEVVLINEEGLIQFSVDFCEMFVNNNGRELHPCHGYKPTGLNPTAKYIFGIKMVRLGEFKWKWENGEWLEDKSQPCSELPKETREVLTEPKTGEYWMKNELRCPKIFTIGSESKATSSSVKRKSEAEVEKIKADRAERIEKQKKTMLQVVSRVKYYQCLTLYLEDGTVVFRREFPRASILPVTAYKSAACKAMKSSTNKFVRGDVRLGAKNRMAMSSGSSKPSSSSSANSSVEASPPLMVPPPAQPDQNPVQLSSDHQTMALEQTPNQMHNCSMTPQNDRMAPPQNQNPNEWSPRMEHSAPMNPPMPPVQPDQNPVPQEPKDPQGPKDRMIPNPSQPNNWASDQTSMTPDDRMAPPQNPNGWSPRMEQQLQQMLEESVDPTEQNEATPPSQMSHDWVAPPQNPKEWFSRMENQMAPTAQNEATLPTQMPHDLVAPVQNPMMTPPQAVNDHVLPIRRDLSTEVNPPPQSGHPGHAGQMTPNLTPPQISPERMIPEDQQNWSMNQFPTPPQTANDQMGFHGSMNPQMGNFNENWQNYWNYPAEHYGNYYDFWMHHEHSHHFQQQQ